MFFPFHDINPIKRWPVVTISIIAINVGVQLYMQSLTKPNDDRQLLQFVYVNGFIPARIQQLSDPKPIVIDARKPNARLPGKQGILFQMAPNPNAILITSITAMFMHGGWYHLISNMWFFWIFGNNIEDRLGHVLFLLFYLGGGIMATACHSVIALNSPDQSALQPIIGASGAVAVTLGAYAVFYPFARVRTLVFVIFIFIIEIPALAVLGVWFASQIIGTLQPGNVNANIAWWAHIGGFVAGAVLMPLLAAVVPEHELEASKRGRPGGGDWYA